MEKNNNQNQKIICKSEFEKITNVTELLNFCKAKDTSLYENIDSEMLRNMISALTKNLRETKVEKDKKGIVQAMQNILNKAPSNILSSKKVTELLKSLKDNCIDNVVIDGKRVGELLVRQGTKQINFGTYLMFISYCKNNSVPSDIFYRTINIMINDKDNFIRASKLMCQTHISRCKTGGYYKYMFTPSLINFLKSKFKFEKGYNLEQDLKNNFEEENFVEGASCDLNIILYRLYFESYISIPHKKEDVIKLFESTKCVLPEDCKELSSNADDSVRLKISYNLQHFIHDSEYKLASTKVYSKMDKFVEKIFKEKGTSKRLTLEDLKILNFSNFKFATDNNTKGITKERFLALIPNIIDDEYYFIWLI